MKIYIHISFPTKQLHNGSYILDVEEDTTIQDLFNKLHQINSEIHPNFIEIRQNPQAKKIERYSSYMSTYFEDEDDVYLSCDLPKAIKVVEEKTNEVQYKSIQNHSFYEYDEWRVRVELQLDNIGDLPKENIKVRFLERALDVKITNYRGFNYSFGSPKTQCEYNPEKSKYVVKQNKIMFTLYKNSKEDNFFQFQYSKGLEL